MNGASRGLTALFLILEAAVFLPNPAMAEEADVLNITLFADRYELLGDSDARRIEMEGFGQRPEPGKPLLPSRTILYLLPPGAVACSLEIICEQIRPLAGSHRIAAASPLLALSATPEQRAEEWRSWERVRREAYASDAAYPERAAEISAAGALREYAYVAVTYHPFAYHPLTGRLELRETVEVAVHYDLPPSDPPRTAPSRAAATRAARLFTNFAEARALYASPTNPGADSVELHQYVTVKPHEYVIVTVNSLLRAIQTSDFLAWKTSLGLHPRVVLDTDPLIANQPGVDLAARIRNFLREYYLVWGIEYVLLVGNFGTIPMRYCFPDFNNHNHTPWNYSNFGGSVPTDHYFADLSLRDELSWDADGDGFLGEYGQDLPDFLAEVAVGRVPTNDPERVTYTLDKLVRFEQDTGAWKDQALHGGPIIFHENQNYEDWPFREGAQCMELIENSFMADWPISHYCEHDGLVPSNYPWPAISEPAFVDDWREGSYGIVNWVCHGGINCARRLLWTWDDGDGVFEQDGSDIWSYVPFITVDSALDDDHPAIVFATSCWVGIPESFSQGNLGMALLTEPGFGAAASVICCSRIADVTHYWPEDPGGSETLCLEFNRFLLDGPDGPERVGDAFYDSQFFTHVNYGWNNYKEYKNLYGHNLYGDPALERSGVSLTHVNHGWNNYKELY